MINGTYGKKKLKPIEIKKKIYTQQTKERRGGGKSMIPALFLGFFMEKKCKNIESKYVYT